MKALQVTSAKRLDIIELPQPQPAAGEVLLRIRYVGFCGSDLNTFRGRNALALNPVIPGHEISAVIRYLRRGHCPYCPSRLRCRQYRRCSPGVDRLECRP
ncbi:MAG: alcohol dehydrogenase catalytic domain-containing protein [Bacteroidaceae bacterium]|nr:alcohol dehydrogenase catalytic domain-containing protein [Bacteroidaceae bacterium]